MAEAHLRTYDNLRTVVQKHLTLEGVWRPIVEVDKISDSDYISRLLEPTFGDEARDQAEQVLSTLNNSHSKKLEEALRKQVLQKTMPEIRISESIFRSMCDRLISLRLLNLMRDDQLGCGFDKSYTPCIQDSSSHDWYTPLKVRLNSGEPFHIYFCEPDIADTGTQKKLLDAIHKSLVDLTPMAGYYSLPEVRDEVCQYLKIPEGVFDEALNRILDLDLCPFTVGLQYEGITGRRKPLVRDRGSIQIYNLIRRT